MTPVDQTIFSNEQGTVKGNCFPSCVASLLDLQLETVPEFQEMTDKWFGPFCQFLYEHGCRFQGSFFFKPNTDWQDLLKVSPGVDGFFIVSGPSPRLYVTNGHACLYKDAVMVHDPHSSRAGLLQTDYAYMIERVAT